jgi:hypothetical protein
MEPIQLNMRYEGLGGNGSKQDTFAAGKKCTIVVGSIIDSRSNTETIGHFGPAPVLADGVVGWLTEGVNHLGDSGEIAWGDAGSSSEKAPRLDIALRRVSVYDNPVRLHATVVLNARIQSNADSPTDRLYRGEGDRMDWTGSTSELLEALNLALTDVLQNMKGDLVAACGFLK